MQVFQNSEALFQYLHQKITSNPPATHIFSIVLKAFLTWVTSKSPPKLFSQIPIPVRNISNASHAVNMGISDAYYVDTLRHYYGICKYFLHIKSSSYT